MMTIDGLPEWSSNGCVFLSAVAMRSAAKNKRGAALRGAPLSCAARQSLSLCNRYMGNKYHNVKFTFVGITDNGSKRVCGIFLCAVCLFNRNLGDALRFGLWWIVYLISEVAGLQTHTVRIFFPSIKGFQPRTLRSWLSSLLLWQPCCFACTAPAVVQPLP